MTEDDGREQVAAAAPGERLLFADLLALAHNAKPASDPHWGYDEGERPAYALCCHCTQKIRTDRLDLLLEHAGTCAGAERAAMTA